jgi:hypothetical protein
VRTPWSIRFAQLAAVVWPEPFVGRLADFDLQSDIKASPALAESPEVIEEKRRAHRESFAGVYHQLRWTLLTSFAWIVAWALAACLVHAVGHHRGWRWGAWSGLLAIGSLVVLAWTTLGRLAWRSWRGVTSMERADHDIFWLLYGIGTFLGVLAVRASR